MHVCTCCAISKSSYSLVPSLLRREKGLIVHTVSTCSILIEKSGNLDVIVSHAINSSCVITYFRTQALFEGRREKYMVLTVCACVGFSTYFLVDGEHEKEGKEREVPTQIIEVSNFSHGSRVIPFLAVSQKARRQMWV